ncbi:MAG: J domain-containing protein [Planctomycetota bacterium]|nr:J domain-containing protein [Planctomycetota bacterium]
MSDLPPLPDSNDPHELLGVPESADELTIKRAYLKLIRTYRPERAPEAFQRLHQAYERALEYLSWTRWIEPPEDGEDTDANAPEHPAEDDVRTAWEALARGDLEDARARIETAHRDRPGCVRTTAHRALLIEALGDPTPRATAPLVALIGEDAPVAPWITSVFQPNDVEQALGGEVARWGRLRGQAARHGAIRLLRRRWHRHLLEGRTDVAIREALEPPYLDDAHDDHWLLADAAQEVALAAVWRRPKEAAQLFTEHGHGAHGDDSGFTLEDHYHLIQLEGLGASFREAFDRHSLPALLERWMALWPILDPDEQVELARALAADVERNPRSYLAAFDRMVEVAPSLIGRHGESVEHAGLPPDAEVPLLQRERVRGELETLAGSLPRRQLGKRKRHYADGMRRVFLKAIVELAISPRHILWWLSSVAHRTRETRGSNAMAHHQEALANDLGLAGLYWTCRLRELAERTLD